MAQPPIIRRRPRPYPPSITGITDAFGYYTRYGRTSSSSKRRLPSQAAFVTVNAEYRKIRGPYIGPRI
ncbi:hypothetical protein ANACOL_04376 [Anaerotruncus colihominis DSM 17241]|uniref:Uncharacterized protein n=1 Tax=Anaerotruncus colihominis DSM 17241 TaxID=445972 RepID=B0PHT3_9FIRM|nr:hypothetical protein ANACOL_04376 [Anaerotruncus colihominis DSM 17241]